MMRSLVVLFFIIIATTTSTSFAADVIKVKGKSALLNMKGDPVVAGDTFYAVKPDGKRAAIIKVMKVKGEKAIGKILKGKAEAGYSLEFKPSKGSSKSSSTAAADSGSSDSGEASRAYWGGMLGFTMDSMSVNVYDAQNTDTLIERTAMSGNGFSGKGLFDYELFKQVWFRGTTGLETFNAAGGNRCVSSDGTNTAACDAKIMYLSFDFLGRYVFGQGKMRPWLGGGIGLLFPVTKSATALNTGAISTTNVMVLAGGLDWFIKPGMYIPIQLEYGMLPKSDEVDAGWIGMRAGLAFPFK